MVRAWGNRRGLSRPYLVEITGVAGAGKSTLTQLLCDGDPRYTRAEFIHTRTPIHLAYVAHSLPRLLSILGANVVRNPRLSWADFKLMVYVTEWRRFLRRRPEYHERFVLLDQGPIYALVRLKAQNKGVAASPSFLRWWDEMVASWTDTLYAIVWLDAADDVLRRRIDERAQSHAVKGESAELGLPFIIRYRQLFDQTLCFIKGRNGPMLMRFDTADVKPGSIAAEVGPLLAAQSRSST